MSASGTTVGSDGASSTPPGAPSQANPSSSNDAPGGPNSHPSTPRKPTSQASSSPSKKSTVDTSSSAGRYRLAIQPEVTDPDTSAIVPGTPAVAQTASTYSLSSLPDELKLMVIAQLDCESRDTLRFSITSKEFRDMALARYWSVIKEAASLHQLLRQPLNVQQTYVNMIRHLEIDGTSWQAQSFDHLRFNALQKFVVKSNPSLTVSMEDISNFIGPRLVCFEFKPGAIFTSDEKVANFLPILNRAPGLRVLEIGCELDGVGPKDLLNALQACTELERITVHGEAAYSIGLTIDHEVLRYVATNKKIKTWYYDQKLEEGTIVNLLRNIPSKQGLFLGATHLGIRITSDAAKHLFPHLHSITSLTLFADGGSNILRSVAEIPRLDTLQLQYIGPSELFDISEFWPLQTIKLKKFKLVFHQDLNGSNVGMKNLTMAFGYPELLESLSLDWLADDDFYVGLDATLGLMTSRFPFLKELILPEAYYQVDASSSVELRPWYSVETLELGQISQFVDPSDSQQEIPMYAEGIHRRFPQLRTLTSRVNQRYADLIMEAVESLRISPYKYYFA